MSSTILRLAVSGTYSSGKTTTSQALSIATGLPRTDALTAREIVVDLIPGKRFADLNSGDLLALGLRRLEERIHSEAMQTGSYISDGSVLHEWVYGEARMVLGINPGAPLLHRAVKKVVGIPVKPFMRRYLGAYGVVAKARACRQYDAFVHLPVEFEMAADGHRPVSEKYRIVADRMLTDTLDELAIPYHVVRGTAAERVTRIVEIFDLPLVMPIGQAIMIAAERIRAGREMVAEKQLATQTRGSMLDKMKYAVRY